MGTIARRSVVLTLLIGLIAWGGCIPSDEATPTPEAPIGGESPDESQPDPVADAQSALTTWQECLADAQARMTDSACSAAAATLARAGGPPLEQALAKLDDPTTSPHGKVMIVEGFNGRLNSYAAAILKGMTAPGKDETTRACATALLSSIPDLDLLQFLIPLTSDSNPQVKFSALLGVASAAMEGSEFRKQLADLYAAPDTNANMKEHIVAVFSKNPYKTDVPILVTAVQDSALNPDVRRDAAIALGRVGDQAAMDALMNIEPAAGAELRTAVDLSIAAIKERSQAEMGEDSVNMTVKLPPAEPAAAP